ncbi:hypothetical protein J3E69DRAFT_327981 [Trichoderma sp. SZMC 28015]
MAMILMILIFGNLPSSPTCPPRHVAHGPAALKIGSRCRHGEIFPASSFKPQASSHNNSTHYSCFFCMITH